MTSVHPRYDARIFFKECRFLSEFFNVFLIVADGKGDEEIDSIHIFDVGKPLSRLQRVLYISNKVYRKATELNCSIYHFHDPELLRIGRKLVRNGKKVIYDVHEDVPNQIKSKKYLNILIRILASSYIKHTENHYSRHFSAIITATEYIKKRFLINNPCTFEVQNYPLSSEFEGKMSFARSENRICYIGGISSERGIFELIQVFNNEHNNFFLELAGEIENAEILNKIQEVNSKRINYLGVLNRSQIVELIRKSKIGLVILHSTENHLNSLPVKMFEYMAGGIPVIASDFKVWKEIIEGNKCGICVDPYDLNAIQKAIQFLVENESQRAKMGENGQNAVRNKYQWESEFSKLKNVYEKLAEGC